MDAVWAIGLMTGTVLDGNVDIALVRTDGQTVAEFGPWALMPYPRPLRALLADALAAARAWQFEGEEPPMFSEAEAALTEAQSCVVTEFLAAHGIAGRQVAVIGFHGQTVLHRAPTADRPGRTRQLGNGEAMARATGIDVVFDHRSADMLAGGQGAPLAATYHAALMDGLPDGEGTAVLNLGGVANLTWRGRDGRLMAFDTGPANAPLNDWVQRATGAPMDRDGALARAGRVDEARLDRLLSHAFLSKPPPKSLDRFDFGVAMVEGLSLEDGAATLAAFVGATVGRALDLTPERPRRLAVCGGGRRNPAIMHAIRTRAGVEAVDADSLGWRGDAIEAECFAYLAVRTLRGLPTSYPSTTGASTPIIGGRVARAATAP